MSAEAFANPQSVTFSQGRWDVRITVVDWHGETHNFVASADSYYTDRDGIWFSTQKEYEEYEG